jgi:hypothetical protein
MMSIGKEATVPEWLACLLCVLIILSIAGYVLYWWAHDRGYEAGMDDSLRFSRYVDEVIQEFPADGNRPPFTTNPDFLCESFPAYSA